MSLFRKTKLLPIREMITTIIIAVISVWGERKSCHQSGWQIWFVSLSRFVCSRSDPSYQERNHLMVTIYNAQVHDCERLNSHFRITFFFCSNMSYVRPNNLLSVVFIYSRYQQLLSLEKGIKKNAEKQRIAKHTVSFARRIRYYVEYHLL